MATRKEDKDEVKGKDEAPKDAPAPRKAAAKTAKKRSAPGDPGRSASAAGSRPRKGTTVSIGIDVPAPKETCTDRFCPFHGTLPVRGQILEGYMVSDSMQGTAVVKREYMKHIPKYERLEKRSGKYLAHNPPCLGASTGDRVKIMECRPLSKRVSFVIVEKMS